MENLTWHSGWPGQAGPGPSLRKRVELDGDERIRAPARRWRARRRVETSPYPSLPFRTPRYCLAPHILCVQIIKWTGNQLVTIATARRGPGGLTCHDR